MYYTYDITTVAHHPHDYYTEQEIFDIELKEFDDIEELEEFLKKEENEHFWPVHDTIGPSWVPVKCIDKEDAYTYLSASLNQSIYETINDI